MQAFFSALLHLDQTLVTLVQQYGPWVYGILFLIIFSETGLVIFPFLPGDSLLFAAGALCGTKSLNLFLVLILLSFAAIFGNWVNYSIGKLSMAKISQTKLSRYIRPKYLERANVFYEKYGPFAIVLSRFIPILRTMIPFVAGIGNMTQASFLLYNVLGGLIWIIGLTLLGYFFGHLQIVKNHFSTVAIAIIIVSLLPILITFLRRKYHLWKHPPVA